MRVTHGHLGTAELAYSLGVSKQRLRVLLQTYTDFPEPVARLASGPVWHDADVARWLAKHPARPPGRPSGRRLG